MKALKWLLVAVFVLAVGKLFLYAQGVFYRALESEKEVLAQEAEFLNNFKSVYGDFQKVTQMVYDYADLRASEYKDLKKTLGISLAQNKELKAKIEQLKINTRKAQSDFESKETKLQAEIDKLNKTLSAKDKELKELKTQYLDLLNKFSSPLILKKRLKELKRNN